MSIKTLVADVDTLVRNAKRRPTAKAIANLKALANELRSALASIQKRKPTAKTRGQRLAEAEAGVATDKKKTTARNQAKALGKSKASISHMVAASPQWSRR